MKVIGFTAHKFIVFIADVPEEMGALLGNEQGNTDALDWGVTPTVVVYTALSVDVVDVTTVVGRQPKRYARYLEVVIEHERFLPLVEELWPKAGFVQKVPGRFPESCYAFCDIPVAPNVPVVQVALSHEAENVVVDGREKTRVVVQPPHVF